MRASENTYSKIEKAVRLITLKLRLHKVNRKQKTERI